MKISQIIGQVPIAPGVGIRRNVKSPSEVWGHPGMGGGGGA